MGSWMNFAPIGAYPVSQGYDQVVERFAKEALENIKWGQLEPYAAGLWHAVAGERGRYSGGAALSLLAEAAFKNDSPSVATTFARAAVYSTFGKLNFAGTD